MAGWDTVPWMVGGGAQHSPEVARVLAYAAFRGNEGIVGADDLRVQALAVPGGKVRIAPGACSILCRSSGQQYQAYAGRLASEDTVDIPPTTSSGGRSDLIVARVEDPWLAGEPWPNPSNPTLGPYIFTRVIPGVPAGTQTLTGLNLGYSGIPLGRIDIPASTATITQAMITDLRQVANPRRERDMKVLFPAADNNIPTSGNYTTVWPSVATLTIAVPPWATLLRLVVTLQGIEYIPPGSGSTVAGLQTRYSGNLSGQNGILLAPAGAGPHRGYYAVAGEHPIPAADRGTSKNIAVVAVRSGGTGTWQADYQSIVTMDWEFVEKAS